MVKSPFFFFFFFKILSFKRKSFFLFVSMQYKNEINKKFRKKKNSVIENRKRENDRSDIILGLEDGKFLIVKKSRFCSFSIYIYIYSFQIVNIISSKFYKISDV